uniref:NADH dehydrogenase subunit 4L n=1 Tax=Salinator rhamphidia TaxID=981055 RepID=G8HR49_9GAST|nr:NADH dehydrogenase subunit 4L [Salinator rhamphidia]AEQ93895.1 NADH dehydrogenase subunit 4L [Salinator rhamphidia]
MLMSVSLVLLVFFLWAFNRQRMHVLNLLISLEAVMLSVLVFYYFVSTAYLGSGHMFLMLLTLAACEAAIGLSLLVGLLRVWQEWFNYLFKLN